MLIELVFCNEKKIWSIFTTKRIQLFYILDKHFWDWNEFKDRFNYFL